jgi:hypothetical protein
LHGSVLCVLFPEIVPLNTLALVIHACLMYAAVCEEVCGKPNLFDDQLRIMETVRCMDDVRELIKQQDRLTQLEDRVKAWMKKVQEVYYFIFRHRTGLHLFFFWGGGVMCMCCLWFVVTPFMLYTFCFSFWSRIISCSRRSGNEMFHIISQHLKTALLAFQQCTVYCMIQWI